MNILITGCGGDIAQAITKTFSHAPSFQYTITPWFYLIGCDISKKNAGRFYFPCTKVVPRAGTKDYLSSISKIIKEQNLDLIIPMSESELRYFTEEGIEDIDGVPLLMANKKTREIGFDKYKTYKFLKDNSFPYPWTQKMEDGKPIVLPCIAKPRFLQGSKHLTIIDEDNVDFYYNRAKNPGNLITNELMKGIFQEKLEPSDEEYTCGVYRTKKGETRTIIFRRKLHGGITGYGKVVRSRDIEVFLKRLAEKLDLRGSINVQLIYTDKAPIVFEINPRFSSTVLFRHILGFKDVIWSVKEMLGEEIDKYEIPEEGTEIFKSYEHHLTSRGRI